MTHRTDVKLPMVWLWTVILASKDCFYLPGQALDFLMCLLHCNHFIFYLRDITFQFVLKL